MPRYADSLLADGERIALRSRQHWLATIVDGRGPWALLVIGVILFGARVGMGGEGIAQSGVGYLAFGAVVVALVLLARVYWSWYAQDYIVTNRRVLKVEGILNKRSADSSLEKINDAVLEQNVLGRILGYGDLDILTAAEASVDQYRMLNAAPRFKKVMLDAKHELEIELGRAPGAPMNTPGTSGSSMSAEDRKSTRLNSSHIQKSRMPSSA